MSKPVYLVTGGCGFIGYHLVKRLYDNGLVVVIDKRFNERLVKVIFPWLIYIHDINNIAKLESVFKKWKFDAVFHLAANSDISIADPQQDYIETFLTTFNILTQCKINNVKKFVLASTSAVYKESDEMLTEESELGPISHYGASKLSSEAFVRTFCYNYGIQSWILRFPNVVGQYMTHGVIFDIINKLRRNNKVLEVLGDGSQTKPYIHVYELIDAILYIFENANEKLNIFNIAGKGRTSVSEIVNLLKGMAKVNYTGGNRGWIGDINAFSYDITKLERLGWKPKMTSTEAVKLTIKQCKELL